MKDAIILVLFVLIVLLLLGVHERPQPLIEDVTAAAAAPVRPAAARAGPMPTMRLYTTYPLDRRNVPIIDERTA